MKNNNFVFDKKELAKLAAKETPRYFIGVDTYDTNSYAYCLVLKLAETTEILLSKTMSSKYAFDEEVANLAKYFNAAIIKEK